MAVLGFVALTQRLAADGTKVVTGTMPEDLQEEVKKVAASMTTVTHDDARRTLYAQKGAGNFVGERTRLVGKASCSAGNRSYDRTEIFTCINEGSSGVKGALVTAGGEVTAFEFRAGDYAVAPAGVAHAFFISEGTTMLNFKQVYYDKMVSTAVSVMNDDGEIIYEQRSVA